MTESRTADTGRHDAVGPHPLPGHGLGRRYRPLLLCINMYLRYVLDMTTVLDVVPRVHGFVYMAYLVTVFDLSFRMKWPLSKGVLICLAGTVPFLSFVAEHRVTRETREALAAS